MFTPKELQLIEETRTISDPAKFVCTNLFTFKNRILKAQGKDQVPTSKRPCFCAKADRVTFRDEFVALYDAWKNSQ